MISKYVIITGSVVDENTLEIFEKKVQEGIDKGWQPYGDPFMKSSTPFIYQAMVLTRKS